MSFLLYDTPEPVERTLANFTGYRMTQNADGSWVVVAEFQRGTGTSAADFDPVGSGSRERLNFGGAAAVAEFNAVRDRIITALQNRGRVPAGSIL